MPWQDYAQRINLEQAAERGYVPLMADPHATALALRTRSRIRAALGLQAAEATREAMANDGFIGKRGGGQAFLPVGLAQDELLAATSAGGELETARRSLPRPLGLECVLASATPNKGITVHNGAEVSVP